MFVQACVIVVQHTSELQCAFPCVRERGGVHHLFFSLKHLCLLIKTFKVEQEDRKWTHKRNRKQDVSGTWRVIGWVTDQAEQRLPNDLWRILKNTKSLLVCGFFTLRFCSLDVIVLLLSELCVALLGSVCSLTPPGSQQAPYWVNAQWYLCFVWDVV